MLFCKKGGAHPAAGRPHPQVWAQEHSGRLRHLARRRAGLAPPRPRGPHCHSARESPRPPPAPRRSGHSGKGAFERVRPGHPPRPPAVQPRLCPPPGPRHKPQISGAHARPRRPPPYPRGSHGCPRVQRHLSQARQGEPRGSLAPTHRGRRFPASRERAPLTSLAAPRGGLQLAPRGGVSYAPLHPTCAATPRDPAGFVPRLRLCRSLRTGPPSSTPLAAVRCPHAARGTPQPENGTCSGASGGRALCVGTNRNLPANTPSAAAPRSHTHGLALLPKATGAEHSSGVPDGLVTSFLPSPNCPQCPQGLLPTGPVTDTLCPLSGGTHDPHGRQHPACPPASAARWHRRQVTWSQTPVRAKPKCERCCSKPHQVACLRQGLTSPSGREGASAASCLPRTPSACWPRACLHPEETRVWETPCFPRPDPQAGYVCAVLTPLTPRGLRVPRAVPLFLRSPEAFLAGLLAGTDAQMPVSSPEPPGAPRDAPGGTAAGLPAAALPGAPAHPPALSATRQREGRQQVLAGPHARP